MVATAIGLALLCAILWTLLSRGFGALSLAVFTQMTPAPGSAGGLLNAIFGSLVMTALGILIGAPIGLLAGTYLAEYGRSNAPQHRGALHQRRAAERALDHHRPVRVHAAGDAHGALLGDRRRGGAGASSPCRSWCAPPRTC